MNIIEMIPDVVHFKSASHDYQGQACSAGFLRKPLTIMTLGGFIWKP
jgi:hypothetical protein